MMKSQKVVLKTGYPPARVWRLWVSIWY